MHFRSRPSRFAIPFVRGLFHARFSRPTLLYSSSALQPPFPSVHPRRECFTRWMTYIPNAFPYANRARSETPPRAAGYRWEMRLPKVTRSNKRDRGHSYVCPHFSFFWVENLSYIIVFAVLNLIGTDTPAERLYRIDPFNMGRGRKESDYVFNNWNFHRVNLI